MQILSYTFYLSIELSEYTQSIAKIFYIFNFSHLITPLIAPPNNILPTKFKIMGKTGYFLADAFGVNITMLIVFLLYYGCLKLGKKFDSISRLFKKINPYLVTYTFRLIVL
jgi:hypothetical protein